MVATCSVYEGSPRAGLAAGPRAIRERERASPPHSTGTLTGFADRDALHPPTIIVGGIATLPSEGASSAA